MKLYFHAVGHGHPLVILHGLFGSSDNWFTLSKFFGEKYKVYAVDQRNHGRSPHSDEFSYRIMADDINDLLIHEGIQSVYLMGHSMGGKTAMQFALMYTDKVDRLIVVDIAPKAYPRKHDAIFEALFSLDLDKYKTRSELDSALSRHISDYAVRQLLLKNVFRDDGGNFKWRIDVASLDRNYDRINEGVNDTRQFEKPALFIRGAKSSYILDSDLPKIKSLFPSAKVVSIEGAGHWVHAEAPRKFSEAVMEFLDRR
ncbi:MAG TPA: alpha/beta fold hydrolase [Candidatus Acidoferrales bacterium]|nr:alpha/beta fold hydrolase [Candidatus Acidoferrales bacterium]